MLNSLSTRLSGNDFSFSLIIREPAEVPVDVASLSSLVEPFLLTEHLGDHERNAVQTAIEELLTNLAKYGRSGEDAPPDTVALTVEGTVSVSRSEVALRLRDNGCDFNPALLPEPTLLADPERLTPGGMGIHMLKQMFSAVCHVREGGCNMGEWMLLRNEK